MKSIRNRLYRLLYTAGLHRFLDMVLGPDRLTVVLYHRVTERDDPTVLDENVISATPDSFERQMKYLSNHFNVISMFDLVAALNNGKPLPPRALLITFDDGYIDNFVNAFPILERYKLPAVLFLTTGFVDQSVIPWWDECSWYFSHTDKQAANIPLIGQCDLSGEEARIRICKSFQMALKRTPTGDWATTIEKLRHELDVPILSPVLGYFMSWDDARSLAESNILCQPHTVTHPILSQVSSEYAYEEIHNSIARIRQECDVPVISFAYPNGKAADYSSSDISILEQEGVQAAFTTVPVLLRFRDLDAKRYDIPRIAIHHSEDLPVIALKLTGFSMIRKLRAPFAR